MKNTQIKNQLRKRIKNLNKEHKNMECPMKSKYMSEAKAIAPLHINKIDSTKIIDEIYSNTAYEGRNLARAAKLLVKSLKHGEKIWLGISGAATPAGLGGVIADMIKAGHISAITSTGANVYHDLHFAFGLPVRQGTDKADDDALFDDETTRIHTTFIHNRWTLKAQDLLVQEIAKPVLERLKEPHSSATFMNEFGKEMLNDPRVIDKEGSFVCMAAKHGVPIFLDSQTNHSLGMNLAALNVNGNSAEMSPAKDIIEAAALSIAMQPQFNLFIGEGGPRNFIQTTGPTAAEIFYVPFDGSTGGIILSVADTRAGALSGSTFSEAKSWGKYKEAHGSNKEVVWGEYTITLPLIASYTLTKVGSLNHSRFMDNLNLVAKEFERKIEENAYIKKEEQEKLNIKLKEIVENEQAQRKLIH